MVQIVREDHGDQFTPIREYPSGVKLDLQAAIRAKHGDLFDEPQNRKRDFRTLIRTLLLTHFTLVKQSGKKIDTDVGEAIEAIVNASVMFYARQTSLLTVTDYVTDFLDIVFSADLAVALKR